MYQYIYINKKNVLRVQAISDAATRSVIHCYQQDASLQTARQPSSACFAVLHQQRVVIYRTKEWQPTPKIYASHRHFCADWYINTYTRQQHLQTHNTTLHYSHWTWKTAAINTAIVYWTLDENISVFKFVQVEPHNHNADWKSTDKCENN